MRLSEQEIKLLKETQEQVKAIEDSEEKEAICQELPNRLYEAIQEWQQGLAYSEKQPTDIWADALEAVLLGYPEED
jgi:glutamine synthetase